MTSKANSANQKDALKQEIMEMFMDFSKSDALLYGNEKVEIDKFTFSLIKKGKTEYDYDNESESGNFHVYEVSSPKRDAKVYVKINLWYTSYEGLMVKGYSFVDPAKKTVIVYE